MKHLFWILGLWCMGQTYAQDYQDTWTGFFSFVSIKDVAQSEDRIYVASENAVYSFDIWSGDIETLTTINGLSGESITEIHYSQTYGLLMIGHDNGLIELLSDNSDQVVQIVDILEKPSIPPNIKRINHFYEYGAQLYIATDYGISVYDLNALEFGDTYYIGALGSTLSVSQTTILDPYIYAASAQSGVKRALLDGPDLIDYNSWESVVQGGVTGIQTLNDAVYFARTNQRVLRLAPEPAELMADFGSDPIVDFRVNLNVLTITTEGAVYTYGADFNPLNSLVFPNDLEDQWTVGLGFAEVIYAGTNENGLLRRTSGNQTLETIVPLGPIRNDPFAIDTSPGQLWVGFGEVTVSFNPYPLSYRGLSQYKDELWHNIPAAELLGASDIVNVKINPKNPDEVFCSSFQFGLLKVNNGAPEILYDASNSPLAPPTDNPAAGLRVYGADFDRDNNMWFVQTKVDEGLVRLSPTGQMGRVDLTDIINPEDELALTDVQVSREGYVFFGSAQNGLIGFNPTNNSFNRITEGAGNGNLPSTDVRTLAFDTSNRLWIGTREGLRVLYNVNGFFQNGNTTQAQSIIILEDGVAQELLFQQSVTDIEVDGSNNKWIATASSGVFYVSSNGQETLLRFTKDNSPLPSNNVQDIAIDDSTGRVYFATTKGLVAFEGTATEGRDDLANAYVFPNPVRPNFTGSVTIDGLSSGATVKITDVGGNLVHEATSQGGSVLWDTRAFGRYKVASGVYFVLITAQDAIETKVLKIMIIR
jgi:ligand-binding sensor domain-containing protein